MIRLDRFAFLYDLVKDLGGCFILPEAQAHSEPSWFGFPLTCLPGVSRSEVVQALEKNGVQTRMLFAGNLLRHPCLDAIRGDASAYRTVGDLANTDRILRDTFWIGVYPGMTREKLRAMADALHEAVR